MAGAEIEKTYWVKRHLSGSCFFALYRPRSASRKHPNRYVRSLDGQATRFLNAHEAKDAARSAWVAS